MTTEEWRDIPETAYRVSSRGRVSSEKYGDERQLKMSKERGGYLKVTLYLTPCVQTIRKVSHLVACAFVGPRPSPKHEINHIDGNRANNCADNLEWVTSSENKRHRYNVLKHGALRGENHPRSKIPESAIPIIKNRMAAGERPADLAREFGVRPQSISSIKFGKTWRWIA